MDPKREILRHFLAALAYRTQKALRGAPDSFSEFRAAAQTRTPHELVLHMDSVLGYARTFFIGGEYRPARQDEFTVQVRFFHEMLESLARHLESDAPFVGTTAEQMLQGPFADAMTHAGQLAMLRRLAGAPIPPENFIVAEISAGNLGPDQPPPMSPDEVWPEAPDRKAT
jgi:hypothetical protein